MKDIFKNKEFETLFSKVQNDVKDYVEENNVELDDDLTVENLIMWQMTPSGHYFVHPTEKCPENLKPVVMSIITKHNPTV